MRPLVLEGCFYRIVGESMKPTLREGEYIAVRPLGDDGLESLARDRIVVLRTPGSGRQFSVKRIAGISGDTLAFRDGRVRLHRDPEIFGDPDLPRSPVLQAHSSEQISVPWDHVFLIGDNPRASVDSLRWGALPIAALVGRAWAVVWPPGAMRLLHRRRDGHSSRRRLGA